MDDFLLLAIRALQDELDPDIFLRDVLEQIIEKKSSSDNSSPSRAQPTSSFQVKTLAELSSRLLHERDLKLEVERLSKERDDLRATQNETQLRLLAEQRDASIAAECHTKTKLQETTDQLTQLQIKIQQRTEALQTHQNTEKYLRTDVLRLEAEVATLSRDNSRKEQALQALEDVQAQNWELSEEIDELQVRNQELKQNTTALKRRCAELSRGQTIRRPIENGQNTSDSQSTDESESEAEQSKAKYQPPDLVAPGIPNLPEPPLSETRRLSLDDCHFFGALPELNGVAIFNRSLLMTQLGGGMISLQVRIGLGHEKPLARRLGISSFMCPNLDHNPWAPLSPGKGGFMFVGLGNDKDVFSIPETHELFVQFAPKRMYYAGRYRCSKVEDLNREEWLMLETKIKRKYCETTKSKAKDNRSADEIMAAYNEGRLRAPCVSLKCIDYNWDLYNSLTHAQRSTEVSPLGCSSTPGSAARNSPRTLKRNRLTAFELSSEDSEPGTPSARRYETRPKSKRVRYVELGTPKDFQEDVSRRSRRWDRDTSSDSSEDFYVISD